VLKEAADAIEYLQKQLDEYEEAAQKLAVTFEELGKEAHKAIRINAALHKQLEAAKEDLKHWKICGTCGNFKNGHCTFPKQNWRNANYVGCKMWQWRGETEKNIEKYETVVSSTINRYKE